MVDDDIRSLLRRNLELTKENNRLLRKIRRATIYGNILRIIWWAIVIGVPIVLYYYIFVPYFNNLSQSYEQIRTEVGGFNDTLKNVPLLEHLLPGQSDTGTGQ